MRAIVFAGVFGAILLTTSVVVGFFQNAAFIAQTSAQRGRRHSFSQVVMSAGTSGDDLSALLETAKTEMGVNKVPSLGSYIANKNVPSLTASADWDKSKANIELLKSNTIKMTGRDPSEIPPINFPKFSPDDMPKMDLPDIGSFDFSSIQQYFASLSPTNQVLVGVAVGATLLIAGASRNKESPPKKKSEAAVDSSSGAMEATSVALGGLTEELGTLQDRMKVLEASGLDLDTQLKDAKSTLIEKELEISKAQLEAADTSLTLNREIDLLKEKLQDNHVKVNSLDNDLTTARDECLKLSKELEEDKKEEMEKAAAEAAKLAAKKKAEEAAAKKKATEEANKLILEAAKKADEAGKKKKAEEAAKKKKKNATSVEVEAFAKNGDQEVKILIAFLKSKGISTVDVDGNMLTKARLIETVNSLFS